MFQIVSTTKFNTHFLTPETKQNIKDNNAKQFYFQTE